MNPPRRAGRRSQRDRTQKLHVLLRLRIVAELPFAAGVELELARVDDEIDPFEVRELFELAGRPFGLHRAPPHEEVDVADAARLQRGERVVGDVGGREVQWIPPENARHVDGDVAGSDDSGNRAVEIDRQIEKVRVGAVPCDQRRRGVAARQVLAGDAEAPVALAADGNDDLIVVPPEVGDGEIAPQVDVAQEAHPRIQRDALEDSNDLLDLRMIRRDAESHQPVRRRQAIEEIDPEVGSGGAAALGKQRRRGVETGRAGADDGNPERSVDGAIGGAREVRRHRE